MSFIAYIVSLVICCASFFTRTTCTKVWGFYQSSSNDVTSAISDHSNVSLLDSFRSDSRLECFTECAHVSACVTVAFDDVTNICSLSSDPQECSAHEKVVDSNLFTQNFNYLTENILWKVRGTHENNECDFIPCGVGGECKQYYRSFECECFLGYGGENCSIGVQYFIIQCQNYFLASILS